MKRAAVLWTGGKDSFLALLDAKQRGFLIDRLITFTPPRRRFLAHPLALIKRQAEALSLPHQRITIRAPYRKGYERAVAGLKRSGIEALVSGDIDLVGGLPNWMAECCRAAGVRLLRPLWRGSRRVLAARVGRRRIKAVFSCVDTRFLEESWVGRKLDARAFSELRNRKGVDLMGEQGEYHTMVLAGPGFSRRVPLEIKGVGKRGRWRYLKFGFVQDKL